VSSDLLIDEMFKCLNSVCQCQSHVHEVHLSPPSTQPPKYQRIHSCRRRLWVSLKMRLSFMGH
jgi:hypothetical protein